MPADRVKQKVINFREGSTQTLRETSNMPVSCGSDGKSTGTFLTLSLSNTKRNVC